MWERCGSQKHTSPDYIMHTVRKNSFREGPRKTIYLKGCCFENSAGGNAVVVYIRIFCALSALTYACKGAYFMMTAVERLKGTPHSKPGDKNSRIALQEVSTKYIALCYTARVENWKGFHWKGWQLYVYHQNMLVGLSKVDIIIMCSCVYRRSHCICEMKCLYGKS